jgi:hypothetical protein
MVYCPACWWGYSWDATQYGQDYDFSKPFFEQFFELQKRVPHMGAFTSHTTMVNSEYTNLVGNLKNCYLIFNGDYNEGCCYGTEIESSKDCFDNLMIEDCQLCHECVNCRKCYRAFYSIDCEASSDIWFSRNLSGCTSCFGCTNLRQKKYHFFNEPLGEEEYKKKVEEIRLDPLLVEEYMGRRDIQALLFPFKFAHTLQNKNVSGDYVYNCKNVLNSYVVTGGENCRYVMWGLIPAIKDAWDFTEWGNNVELLYECMGVGENSRNCRFTRQSFVGCHDLEYCLYCISSGNLFGCVSVKKHEYCILNKEYPKDEFESLRAKIIEQMRTMPYISEIPAGQSGGRNSNNLPDMPSGRAGEIRKIEYRYGEFFPIEHSQFAYNETNAMELFLLTKDEAVAKGYPWKDTEAKNYKATIEPENLPDIKTAPDTITQEVVSCGHKGECADLCTMAFRIIPQELQFYRSMSIPLPLLCPNCRHGERLKLRNPIGLYKRACTCGGANSRKSVIGGVEYKNTALHFHSDGACPNEFETSYAPSRPEIVYCEQCYLAEVI